LHIWKMKRFAMPSSQSVNLSIRGLFTYPSELSGAPEGALQVADDININRANIAEPRRGFDRQVGDFNSPSNRADKMWSFKSTLLAHNGLTMSKYVAGAWVDFGGSFDAGAGYKIRDAQLAKSFYFTTLAGVRKIDSLALNPKALGVPKGLNITVVGSGSSGIVAVGYAVSYRYVIGTKDANNVLILGEPSPKLDFKNAAATSVNPTVTIVIPSGLTTSHFIQLYRTQIASTGVPGDEMQQMYSYNITSTDLVNGYVVIADFVPDELLGAYLYTNASQQGIAQANSQPPLAKDICAYKNYLFYANTVSKNRYFLTLTSVTGATGLLNNDTLTLAGQTYTAKSSAPVAANREFLLDTASASPSVRIANSTQALVNLINQDAAATVYATAISGQNDLPGKMLFEERGIGGATFTVATSRPGAWDPQLDTAQSSTNDTFPNRIMFSKLSQPEAVPVANFFDVGSSDYPILRIKALRDSVLIFKGEGTYVLRGQTSSNFSVVPLDLNLKLVADDSVELANNYAYGLFETGFCQVSDSGSTVISLPIKDTLLSLLATTRPQLKSYATAIGYETEGKYICWLPTSSLSTYADQAFVYDYNGASLVRWTYPAGCALINPTDGKLYVGNVLSPRLDVERKLFDYTDFVDYGNSFTIAAFTGVFLTLNDVSGIRVGDIIQQGANRAYVEAITGTVLTMDASPTWSLGAAVWYKYVNSRLQWNVTVAGNPAELKSFQECELLFKQVFLKRFLVDFSSDINPASNQFTIVGSSGSGAFGDFAFGDAVFGGAAGRSPTRTYVPREAARCSQLTVRVESQVAMSDWQLNGISLTYVIISERVAR
jgi:hypothetical protein